MQITQLPGGQTCLLRDPSQVSERARRPLVRALARSIPETDTTGMTQNEVASLLMKSGSLDAISEANDLLAVALIDSWTLTDTNGAVLPVTLESLLDLPGETYDAIQEAVTPFFWATLPRSYRPNVKDPAALTDPETPTVPSDV